MQINVSFDQSKFLPTAFVTAVNWAVNYLDNQFTNNVTLNINVGFGEVGGYLLGAGDLGASIGNYVSASYSSVRTALLAENAPGASTLATTSPLPGTLYMPVAEARALNLFSAPALDGWVGFSNAVNWSFTPNATPPANAYDFVGTFEHEITEIMGRVSLMDYQPGDYAVADLYRYTATGAHSLSTGGAGSLAYFSVDGGHTLLASWNNNPANGDLGDWYGQAANDMANDYAKAGAINPFSAVDLTEMQALGWTTVSSGTAGGSVTGPTPPPAPVIASFSPDSGVVGDGITDVNILKLAGTAVANSTVKVYEGTTLLGSATATASGTWTFTTPALADGSHHFTATDTDASGTVSSLSSALNVTIDTLAPNAPAILSDAVINSDAITLAGTTEANATVRVYEGSTLLGSAHASPTGSWSYTTAALADGSHTLAATATDVAGNTSAVSQTVTLTTSGNGTPISSKGTITTTSPTNTPSAPTSDPTSGLVFKSATNELAQDDSFIFSNDIATNFEPASHFFANVDHNDSNVLVHLLDQFAEAAKVQSVVSEMDHFDIHSNGPTDSGFHF